MKKTVKYLSLMLVMFVAGLSFASCSDDKDEPIAADTLPTQAQTFIKQYFPTAAILTTTKDKDEYEVTLSDGTRIDFNKAGEWTDVDALVGKTIPSGFYPAAIDTYVDTTFQGIGINEISKETRWYDVELVTGTELLFSYEGSFIGFDK